MARFTESTREALAESRWCAFNEWGLSYQKCRFCDTGFGDVSGLWKYGVRHYACQSCKDTAMKEYREYLDVLNRAISRRFAEGR